MTRACVPVAKTHVGDGQWHQAKLEFDFTRDFAVESLLIAPRINEVGAVADGEWLVDDIECIENPGWAEAGDRGTAHAGTSDATGPSSGSCDAGG